MKIIAYDNGDTLVGIFGGYIILDLGDMTLDIHSQEDIKSSFKKFLIENDLVIDIGEVKVEE